MRISLLALAFLFLGFFSPLKSQDIHYSQFFNSALNVNPALTGIFNGDKRISANFRRQWHSVPVPYLTFSGAYDQKFNNPRSTDGFWSGGVLANYDRAGDSRLQLFQLALSGAYTFLLNEKNLVTLGAQGSFAHRSFLFGSELQWDNQFDGVMFNPMLESGESFGDGREGFSYSSFGAGLNYRWQQTSRTNINIGGGFYHLNTPEHNFYEDGSIDWPMRFTANIGSSFQLSDLLDLQIHGLAQFQGPALEIVPALLLSVYINRQRGKEFRMDLGGMVRVNEEEMDAIAPMVGFDFNSWYVGFSYDINLSEFEIATDRRGGPEISFRYIITNVKPLNNFKTCPIF